MSSVPQIMIGGVAALTELLAVVGRERGVSQSETDRLLAYLPEPLREAQCFLDRLTKLWRYEFGFELSRLPHDPHDTIVYGTHMYHRVDTLYDVLTCARARLPEDKFVAYVTRLGDQSRHADALVEFQPILRLPDDVAVQYEVAGYGEGNATIDWLIQAPGGAGLLLEVKHRVKDLLEGLGRIQAGERGPDGGGPAPTHDPALLFESVVEKFKPRPDTEMIQAVWISSRVQQEKAEFKSAFDALDPARLHAAILGDWQNDVYLLARGQGIKDRILATLATVESRRFVFHRDAV